MRLARAHIVNYRCLRNLSISFDRVTVMVGANSAGKSTVLHALDWFFHGGPLVHEDVYGHQIEERVSVGVTFTDFDDDDRDTLGSYVLGEDATFWRTWSAEEGEKLTGMGRSYPPFDAVRQHQKALEKRAAYRQLREEKPELGLPSASSQAAVEAAMESWEADHPDELQEGRTDATHLFGFAGQGKLLSRMDLVLVPAVADAQSETQDGRGTLLRQLLERALGDQSQMRARLEELEQRVSAEVADIMTTEGATALEGLSQAVSAQLAELVPGGEVSLSAQAPEVRLPSLAVRLRVVDEGLDTAVGRQGHGFQRALLIAVVQQLAAVEHSAHTTPDDETSVAVVAPPALMLAIEEPELYQHPLQARHFAATLAALANQSDAKIQVAYATHSEHFVDPSHYERLRRFQRITGARWPESRLTEATVAAVARRLAGAYDKEEVPLRVRLTLRRQVAEAVFAKAAVIVEGSSDVGLIQGLGDRTGGLDALGIAVIGGHGKRQLLIPWAILTELGVPCYAVFDGDADVAERMTAKGQSKANADAELKKTGEENVLVLRTLGQPPEELPETAIGERSAVFANSLETELDAWVGYWDAVDAFKAEQGEFRGKPDDAYRWASATVPADPPEVFLSLMTRITQLVE